MTTRIQQKISARLASQPQWAFALYASLAAFLTYSCMYAFRKPFTVGLYEDMDFLGVNFKIWLITSQVIGYTLSKFAGIKYIAELKPQSRGLYILLLVGVAELALLLFWITPKPWNIAWMFFNGLPLGLIWGVVFSYLEGRRLTELLGAGLSVSFILASGFVKSIGQLVLKTGWVSEFGMPFVTGLMFAVPLVIVVFFLDCLPPPTPEDERLRTKRLPMHKEERKAFIKRFGTGVVLLVVTYIFLTVFRDLRDNFSAEIWRSLGYSNDPAIFTITELPVAFFTLASLALVTFIRSNYKAFNMILFIIMGGFALVLVSTLLFQAGYVRGEWWMILVGTGLYLGYIPFNAFLYERLISAFRYVSNVGFLIYISDAFGYLGSLGVVFYKNFFSADVSWLRFCVGGGIGGSIIGAALVLVSVLYFKKKYSLHTSNKIRMQQTEQNINGLDPQATI